MGTVFIDMIGVLMVLPLLPYYAEAMDASGTAIGLMTSVFAAAQLVAAPFWGRVSDRFGRRPAILAGLVASALGYVFFALAGALWMLFATRLLQGFGAGTIGVVQAYVGDSVEPKQRAKALGWLTAAGSAGVTLGPVLGSGITALAGGGENGLAPAMAPGFFAAGLCLVNLVFAWRWLPESRVEEDDGDDPEPRRPVRQTVFEVLRHPTGAIGSLVWIYALAMMAFVAIQAMMALFLMHRFGIEETRIGWYYTFLGGLSVFIRGVALGPMVDALGEVRSLRTGAAVMALGFFTMPLAPGPWFFLLPAACLPLGTALLFPTSTSLLSQRARKREMGQVLGVQQSFRGVAGIVGPFWAGAAFDSLGQGSPFLVAGVLMAVVVVATVVLRPGGRPAPPASEPPAEAVEGELQGSAVPSS